MIARFVYIVLLLILTPWLSYANIKKSQPDNYFTEHTLQYNSLNNLMADTVIKTARQKRLQQMEEKKKVKELANAKRLPKPEKIDEGGIISIKDKPKRQRRPAGLERPPEIPRRNGN